jgi:hypothetical protein
MQVLSGSSSETFPTSSAGTYDVCNIKFEEEMDINEEEEARVKAEEVIGSEEEECMDIKEGDGIYCEEEEEKEDLHIKEELNIDIK